MWGPVKFARISGIVQGQEDCVVGRLKSLVLKFDVKFRPR